MASSAEYRDFWARLNEGKFMAGQFKRYDHAGRVLWLEATYNPIFDEDGQLYKIIKFASDITERVDRESESIRTACRISADTETEAGAGQRVIDDTVCEIRSMADQISVTSNLLGELAGQTDAITVIVETIRSIASQTNMFSLNAAVEAARAGEHGRGFSVVAHEVRQLAHRTAEAASEISEMIGKLQTLSGDATTSMQNCRGSVDRGVDMARHAGEAIVRISDCTNGLVTAVRNMATTANLDDAKALHQGRPCSSSPTQTRPPRAAANHDEISDADAAAKAPGGEESNTVRIAS
ncbi:methyl-accepting chemotaxis sensory transducer with Pas/Pac sensor [Salinisphaera sp. C84B14]